MAIDTILYPFVIAYAVWAIRDVALKLPTKADKETNIKLQLLQATLASLPSKSEIEILQNQIKVAQSTANKAALAAGLKDENR